MLRQVYLTLLVGPAVPVPVPRSITEALVSVEVTVANRSTSGFELTFNLSKQSQLETVFLLSGGSAIPLLRVILVVTINGTPSVLIDGVITNVQISSEGNASTLVITGEDLTRVMDYVDFSGIPYPALSPEARVALILAKYTGFGIVPLIIPSLFTEVTSPLERIPRHRGTDLAYIQQLAEEAGYVFYLNPGLVPGSTIAYWGPEVKAGVPQPPLNVGLDAYSNVESLNFSFDNAARTQPVVWIQNPETKAAFPVPLPSDIGILNPPLGLVQPIANQIEALDDTAKLSPVQAVLKGLSTASRSADVVTASGSLDVTRYEQLLQARQLVWVRGAGVAFNGLYFVERVTTSLRRGECKQNFSLTRNAFVSTLPRVPV